MRYWMLYLTQDPGARVACEVFVKTGMVLVGGEITTKAWVDVGEITRYVIKDIGYNSSEMRSSSNSIRSIPTLCSLRARC